MKHREILGKYQFKNGFAEQKSSIWWLRKQKNVEISFKLRKQQNAEMSPPLPRQDFVDQIERPPLRTPSPGTHYWNLCFIFLYIHPSFFVSSLLSTHKHIVAIVLLKSCWIVAQLMVPHGSPITKYVVPSVRLNSPVHFHSTRSCALDVRIRFFIHPLFRPFSLHLFCISSIISQCPKTYFFILFLHLLITSPRTIFFLLDSPMYFPLSLFCTPPPVHLWPFLALQFFLNSFLFIIFVYFCSYHFWFHFVIILHLPWLLFSSIPVQ